MLVKYQRHESGCYNNFTIDRQLDSAGTEVPVSLRIDRKNLNPNLRPVSVVYFQSMDHINQIVSFRTNCLAVK